MQRIEIRSLMISTLVLGAALFAVGPVRAEETSSKSIVTRTAQLPTQETDTLRQEALGAPKRTVLQIPSREDTTFEEPAAPEMHISLRPEDTRCRQVPVGALSPFPISLRLGAMVSPRTKFAGGVDVTLSGVHIIPQLSTRIDADAIISANFGGVSTLIPITFDQIYSQGLAAGSKVYLGAGVGPYIGDVTRLGGKVFVGAGLSSRLSAEADLHFAGAGDSIVTVQLRLGL